MDSTRRSTAVRTSSLDEARAIYSALSIPVRSVEPREASARRAAE